MTLSLESYYAYLFQKGCCVLACFPGSLTIKAITGVILSKVTVMKYFQPLHSKHRSNFWFTEVVYEIGRLVVNASLMF